MTKAEKFKQLTCTQNVRENLRTSSVRAAALIGAAGAFEFVLRIVSTALLTRLLLPEQFGLVMMVTAVTAVADQFRDLGLSSATIQRKDISCEEVTNLFWINVCLGIFIALVICGASPLISAYYRDPRLTLITCVLATNFIFGGLMVQHQALMTRRLKLGHTSTIRLLSSLISTILAVVLAWMGFGFWSLIWREVARSALLTAGMWLCFPWVPGLPCRKTSVRGLIHFGTDLTASYILASVSSSVDRFFIGRYWGPGPVAMYRQAFQLIIAPMDQLFSPVNMVAQPGLSMLQSDDARYRRFFQKVVATISLATMPLSLFVAVNHQEITRIVLGRKWADAGVILMILSLGSFIKWAVMPSGLVLISLGRSRTLLALSVVNSIVVILLMFIGVHWGAVGVAVADAATTYLMMGPRLYYSFKHSPVTIGAFFSAVARPAIASVVMTAALLLVHVILPGLSRYPMLGLNCVVAPVAFMSVWLAMPGGREELASHFADLRSALQKKTSAARKDEPVVVAD